MLFIKVHVHIKIYLYQLEALESRFDYEKNLTKTHAFPPLAVDKGRGGEEGRYKEKVKRHKEKSQRKSRDVGWVAVLLILNLHQTAS